MSDNEPLNTHLEIHNGSGSYAHVSLNREARVVFVEIELDIGGETARFSFTMDQDGAENIGSAIKLAAHEL